MSAGLYRKQYEALKALATTGLGMTVLTPEGSFNEKFCALCRQMVNQLGGAFTGVQGSFSARKAAYLHQVAVAAGLSTDPAPRNTLLHAARVIYDGGNDGEQIIGQSVDWRVYAYLLHATLGLPPNLDDIIQWLKGNTGDEVTDILDPAVLSSAPEIRQVDCLDCDGVNQYIQIASGAVTPTSPSIFLRIKIDSDQGNNDIMGYGRGAFLRIDNTLGRLRLFWDIDGTFLKDIYYAFSLDTWYTISASFDEITERTLVYINGVEILDSVDAGKVIDQGSGAARVGAYSSGYCDCKIAGYGVLDRAMTEAEHLALYESNSMPTNSMRFSPVSDGSGLVTGEPTGNGLEGEINNGATWVKADGIPSWSAEYGFNGLEVSTLHPIELENYVGVWDGGLTDEGIIRLDVTTAGNNLQIRLVSDGQWVTGDELSIEFEMRSSRSSTASVFTFTPTTTWPTFATDSTWASYSDTEVMVADSTYFKFAVKYTNLLAGDWVEIRNVKVRNLTNTRFIPALTEPTKSVLTLDGVGDKADSGVALSGGQDYSGEIEFLHENNGFEFLFDGRDKNDDGFRVLLTDSILYISHNEHDLTIPVSAGLVDGNWHTLSFDKTGTVLSATLDEVLATPLTGVTGDLAVAQSILVGHESVGTLLNFTGKLRNARISGLFSYDFTKYLGKSTTTIDDESGNGNDGTITTTSGLDTIWGTRLADAEGVLVASDYYPITNPPDKVHNGHGALTRQTTTKIVTSIDVSGTGTLVDGCCMPWSSEGVWTDVAQVDLRQSGGSWLLLNTISAEYWEMPDGTDFPPKVWTNVSNLGSPPPALAYDSWWVDESTNNFASRSYADWLARSNLTDKQVDQWAKYGTADVCVIEESILYPQSLVETLAWYNQAKAWAEKNTSSCGGGVGPFTS